MGTIQILPERLERFLRPDFKLRSGTGQGVNSHVDVCIMQAVSWLANEGHFRDAPDCVPATICRYLIRLNDSWLFDAYRHQLKPYAPKIIGLDKSRETEIRRGFIAADYGVRIFLPLWLRFLMRNEEAAELEKLLPIVDKASAIVARDRTKKIYTAADAAAYAAADAAATAAAAAAAAAYATAYAAADAYAAATAAADADAPFCASLRSAALACLDEMIAV